MTTALLFSFFGGILPAFLWLKFWLHEAPHHEPRRIIFGIFVFGMMSVFLAGILEQAISQFVVEYSLLSLFLWAMVEELLKYIGARNIGIKSRFCDNPIDPVIFLTTSALGFAAAENILFLFDPISNGDFILSLSTLSARFVGATVLHVIASGCIGIFIGFSLHKSQHTKKIFALCGFLLATLLHTAFNRFIIQDERYVVWVFLAVWLGLILVVYILERIKKHKKLFLITKQ